MWYHEVIGGRPLPDRRYLVADRDRRDHDLAAARRDRRPSPARATQPLPGIVAEVVDKQGNAGARRTRAASSSSRSPWPAMLRTIYGDDERYKQQYWSQVPGMLLHRRRRPPATRTATSGSWAASTTCSTSPATA